MYNPSKTLRTLELEGYFVAWSIFPIRLEEFILLITNNLIKITLNWPEVQEAYVF